MSFNAKIAEIADSVLRRPLTSEEQFEIYRIADAVGMRDVLSFLHMILVFKLHEDTMGKKFNAMDKKFEELSEFEKKLGETLESNKNVIDKKLEELSELEKRIDETLKNSVGNILESQAQRIGADMGDAVIARAEDVLASVAKYHSLRAQTLLVCFICVVATLAYSLGSGDILQYVATGGVLEAFLYLPGGWSVFFCGLTYTFLWVSDHQKQIKRTVLHKVLLALQAFALLALALTLL